MQNYIDNTQEMEIYRYLTSSATTASSGGGGGGGGVMWPPSYNYGIGGCGYNLMNCNDDETPEAKAVTASRIIHKEAEKRRRERINSHLDRLRSLLPCTTKTDKATLLSKVVQRVLELKRQTSELLELDNLLIPSENDEFNVYIHNNVNNNNQNIQSYYSRDDDNDDDNNNNNNNNNNDDGSSNKIVLKASICCEDRPDLFADLNGVLDSLNLKTVRAEISSLGGRVQSVLIVSGDGQSEECAVFLRDALKGIVQRSGSGSEERLKRRRRAFDSDC